MKIKQRIHLLLGAVVCAIFLAGNLFAANMISAGTVDRQYLAVDTNFYNVNMASLFDNLYDRAAMADPALADAYMANLAARGFDVVIYSGRHFRINHIEEWSQIASNEAIIATACHNNGLKLIEHHELTIPMGKANQFLLDHIDWMQKDIRTGAPWRWICPDNTNFINYYSDYLQNLQSIGGGDGFMLDEMGMASENACGCDYTRQSYETAVGEPMGYETGEEGSAKQRNAVRFRSFIKPKAMGKLLKAVRQVNSQATFLSYISDFSIPTLAKRGGNLANEAAYFSSFVGWEAMEADCFASWRPWVRSGKMRAAMGNYYGIPTWSLNREQSSKEGAYFAWALSQCVKNAVWLGPRVIDNESWAAYVDTFLQWGDTMPFQHARCLTDTGFMLSNQTRFTDYSTEFFWLDAMGWADMLLEEDRQFDVLFDGDTEKPGRLGKYNVLVLVGQAAMSDTQKTNLADWVAAGGNAIITTHTSLYDEFGARRDNFLLADVAGMDFSNYAGSTYAINGSFNGESYNYTGAGTLYSVEPDPGSTVLLNATAGGETYPLIVETPHGAGRFIYVAAELGRGNAEMELRNGSMYDTIETPDDKRLINNLISYARTGNEPLRFDLPDGVQGVAFQLHGGANDGDIYVHLLNTTGKSISYGDYRYYGVPEAMSFPAVASNLVIHTYNATGDAVADSPMMASPTNIAPVDVGGGQYTITVPGSLLDEYLQVVIPATTIAGQVVNPVPIAPGAE